MTAAVWSEKLIAASLARQVFAQKHLVVVPNCSWTGYECDLLVVTPNLRVIDVEVKISRSDFFADAKKDKWFHSWDWRRDGPRGDQNGKPRDWPQKVWKHYYAMPKDIWRDDMQARLPSGNSGLILMDRRKDGTIITAVHKMAKPCREADKISPEDAVDIARLASLRMWDSYRRVDALEKQLKEKATKND